MPRGRRQSPKPVTCGNHDVEQDEIDPLLHHDGVDRAAIRDCRHVVPPVAQRARDQQPDVGIGLDPQDVRRRTLMAIGHDLRTLLTRLKSSGPSRRTPVRRRGAPWAPALLLVLIAGCRGSPAPPGGVPAPTLPPQARAMLDAENSVRARVGVPPLAWSAPLATVAQRWADHLMQTGGFAHRPGNPFGETLYAITGGVASPAEVVASWAAEARDYDPVTGVCRSVCGHYTQIVWRGTRAVGCAAVTGTVRQVWVCEYDPPGNIVGESPY